ncbi:Parallel beta-helix repeat protein [Cylindrospermum sp. NIES-4074]|nr:Parallel beta-helix repeat protein [Cylindrospermum sp. NIES-4074]
MKGLFFLLIHSVNLSTPLTLPNVLHSLYQGEKITASLVQNSRHPSIEKEIKQRSSTLISQTTSKTYYVSGTGSDNNSGLSTSYPFRTIQKAANLTNPGDTVLIMNGEYTNADPNGQVVKITRTGTSTGWISYKAYTGHFPKLRHNGWNGILIQNGASYIEIKGLEIIGNNANITYDYALSQKNNTSNPLTSGNCISIDGRSNGHPHHIRIIYNKIHDCGGAGISAIQTDYVTIDNNEVYNNAWYSPFGNSGISLWQNWRFDDSTGYKMFVRMNKVYNNRQDIPFIGTGEIEDGSGIIIDDSRNTQNGSTLGAYTGRTLIENNISFNNGGSGIHTYLSDYVYIANNTTYLNNQSQKMTSGQIFTNNSCEVYITNNILYAYYGKKVNSNWSDTPCVKNSVLYNYNVYANTDTNSTNSAIKGPNDIFADPRFVNASIGDFRLQSTSPAINKGDARTYLKTDFAGNPRPSGSAYDIGAYEYQY